MDANTATWTITSLVSGVGDAVNGAIDLAASNPLCALFLGFGFVGAAYGLFTKIRRKSK